MIHIITYVSMDSQINNWEHEQLLLEGRGIEDKNLISGVIRRSPELQQKQSAGS